MKINLKEWLASNGYDCVWEALEDVALDDYAYPALCDEDCWVEPDGTCPHNGESILLALGLI